MFMFRMEDGAGGGRMGADELERNDEQIHIQNAIPSIFEPTINRAVGQSMHMMQHGNHRTENQSWNCDNFVRASRNGKFSYATPIGRSRVYEMRVY